MKIKSWHISTRLSKVSTLHCIHCTHTAWPFRYMTCGKLQNSCAVRVTVTETCCKWSYTSQPPRCRREHLWGWICMDKSPNPEFPWQRAWAEAAAERKERRGRRSLQPEHISALPVWAKFNRTVNSELRFKLSANIVPSPILNLHSAA